MQALPPFLQGRHALIQAPMAGVQDSALAIAVSRAGGLGSLPCAMLNDAMLVEEIRTLQAALEADNAPYNLNFFCDPGTEASLQQLQTWRLRLKPFYVHLQAEDSVPTASRRPFDAATARLVAPFKPPVVSFHFGLPGPELLAQVKSWGSYVMGSATTVDEALWLAQHGADAVIAQGLEAGGHRGHFLSADLTRQMGTFALLPQVVRALQPLGVPVIAAGGIASPQAVQATQQLGAVAVQAGTAYLCADEATTSALHRTAVQSPESRLTALTTIFSGRPARGIVNRVMRELQCFPPEAPPFPHASAAITPLRAAAEALGSSDFSPLWCGQNATGCRSASAAHITHWLVDADVV